MWINLSWSDWYSAIENTEVDIDFFDYSTEDILLYEDYKWLCSEINALSKYHPFIVPIKNKWLKIFLKKKDKWKYLDRYRKTIEEKEKLIFYFLFKRVGYLMSTIDIKWFFENEFKDQKITHISTWLRTVCPFHKEKTPSFLVNYNMRVFKCFGCWKGWKLTRYFMDKYSISRFSSSKNLLKIWDMLYPFLDNTESKKRREFSLYISQLRWELLRLLRKKPYWETIFDSSYEEWIWESYNDWDYDGLPF